MIQGVRLKSEQKQPPGGFQYLQAEFGQKKPFTGSIDHVKQLVVDQRRANRFLSDKHGLSVDAATVREEIIDYNIKRCLAHGWQNFLAITGPPVVSQGQPEPVEAGEKKTPVAEGLRSAVGVVKKVAAGVGALIDWLGAGGKPVSTGLAQVRAGVCIGCPLNGSGGLSSYFTAPAAKLITLQLEMKNDLKLQTSYDDKLGVCEACLCPLKLKVHAPLEHILKHTSKEIRGKLHPQCWILDEERGTNQSHAE